MCGNFGEAALTAVMPLAGLQAAQTRKANESLQRHSENLRKEARERDDVLIALQDANEAEQKKLQDKADAEFQETASKFTEAAQRQKIADAIAKREAAFSPDPGAAVANVANTQSAPSIVQEAIDKRLAKAATRNLARNAAQAALGGFEGTQLGSNTELNRNTQRIREGSLLADSFRRITQGARAQRDFNKANTKQLMDILVRENAQGGRRQFANVLGIINKLTATAAGAAIGGPFGAVAGAGAGEAAFGDGGLTGTNQAAARQRRGN